MLKTTAPNDLRFALWHASGWVFLIGAINTVAGGYALFGGGRHEAAIGVLFLLLAPIIARGSVAGLMTAIVISALDSVVLLIGLGAAFGARGAHGGPVPSFTGLIVRVFLLSALVRSAQTLKAHADIPVPRRRDWPAPWMDRGLAAAVTLSGLLLARAAWVAREMDRAATCLAEEDTACAQATLDRVRFVLAGSPRVQILRAAIHVERRELSEAERLLHAANESLSREKRAAAEWNLVYGDLVAAGGDYAEALKRYQEQIHNYEEYKAEKDAFAVLLAEPRRERVMARARAELPRHVQALRAYLEDAAAGRATRFDFGGTWRRVLDPRVRRVMQRMDSSYVGHNRDRARLESLARELEDHRAKRPEPPPPGAGAFRAGAYETTALPQYTRKLEDLERQQGRLRPRVEEMEAELADLRAELDRLAADLATEPLPAESRGDQLGATR